MTARPEIATFEDVYRAEYPRLLRRLRRQGRSCEESQAPRSS